jgi:hypothetical protein
MGRQIGTRAGGRGRVLGGLVEGRPSYDAVCSGPDSGSEGDAGVEEPPHPGGVRRGGEVARAHAVVGAVDDGDGVTGAHQAGLANFEHGADPAGGVEADVEVVDTDAQGQVLAGGRGIRTSSRTVPIRHVSPMIAPLTSRSWVARFSPNSPGGMVRPSWLAHQVASSAA